MSDLHIGNGEQYASLDLAVASASENDRLIIHGGGYICAVRIKKPLTLLGVGIVELCASGLNLKGDSSIPRAILEFYETAADSKIENIALSDTRNGNMNSAGIRLIGTKYVSIINCKFTNCDNGLFASGADFNGLFMQDCIFKMNGRGETSHNVYLSEGQEATVKNCLFDGTIGGQNFKSRIRQLKLLGCTLKDSKNREFDGVESDSTSLLGSYTIIENCKIIKRWVVDNNDGTFTYVPDQSRRPANQQVIQWGDDRDKPSVNNGTLFLINTLIATPFIQPVINITSPNARVITYNSTVVRPLNTPNSNTPQRFVKVGDENKVYGKLNSFATIDGPNYA